MSENTNTPVNSPEKPTKTKPEKSPNTPKITNSQKEKDPRKVAAGKKLAAISKIAKSQKKYKAEVREAQQVNEAQEETNTPKISFNTALGICVGVVVAGVVGLAYFKTKSEVNNKTPPPAPKQTKKPNLIIL